MVAVCPSIGTQLNTTAENVSLAEQAKPVPIRAVVADALAGLSSRIHQGVEVVQAESRHVKKALAEAVFGEWGHRTPFYWGLFDASLIVEGVSNNLWGIFTNVFTGGFARGLARLAPVVTLVSGVTLLGGCGEAVPVQVTTAKDQFTEPPAVKFVMSPTPGPTQSIQAVEAAQREVAFNKAKAINTAAAFVGQMNNSTERGERYPVFLLIGSFGELNGAVDVSGVTNELNAEGVFAKFNRIYVASTDTPDQCASVIAQAYSDAGKALGAQYEPLGKVRFDEQSINEMRKICTEGGVWIPPWAMTRRVPRADRDNGIFVDDSINYMDGTQSKGIFLRAKDGCVFVGELGGCQQIGGNIPSAPCNPVDPKDMPLFTSWLGVAFPETDDSGGVILTRPSFSVFYFNNRQ